MHELFNKGLKTIKPRVLFENICLGGMVVLGKTLMDIYYGKDIWVEADQLQPQNEIEEGTPEFYDKMEE